MSRKRIMCLIVPLLILIPVVALAVGFDWTAQQPGNFNDENNWEPDSFVCYPDCYPQTCNDDATIEGTYGLLTTVYMSTETIDDLTLAPMGEFADVTLDGQGSKTTLTCDSLLIGGTGGEVWLRGKGIIKTEACP